MCVLQCAMYVHGVWCVGPMLTLTLESFDRTADQGASFLISALWTGGIWLCYDKVVNEIDGQAWFEIDGNLSSIFCFRSNYGDDIKFPFIFNYLCLMTF